MEPMLYVFEMQLPSWSQGVKRYYAPLLGDRDCTDEGKFYVVAESLKDAAKDWPMATGVKQMGPFYRVRGAAE